MTRIVSDTAEELEYEEDVNSELEIDSQRTQSLLSNAFTYDTISRIGFRILLLIFFLSFLLFQNIFVYRLVNKAVLNPPEHLEIESIEKLLLILVTGTIAQTVSIVLIMVKWVFTDIDYRNNPLNGQD